MCNQSYLNIFTCIIIAYTLLLHLLYLDCGVLNNITNGAVNILTGTKYQDVATYSCNTGYYINSGYMPRVCKDGGLWNSSEPFCTIYGQNMCM